MAIERTAYKALESVLGVENISEDPSVLLGYDYHAFCCLNPTGEGRFFPHAPEAVVLPESTEEVQGIIKVCNRYNLKFRSAPILRS